MKTIKSAFFIFVLTIPLFVSSQVGIGTTTPDVSAILDVVANDKGILIPRVSLANVTNTMLDGTNTAAIGLLIYNNNASVVGGDGVGYYMFNGTIWEKLITSTSTVLNDADWYEEGTTTAPNNINKDMFTMGNVAIGKNTADYPLDIEESTVNRGITVSINTNSNSDISGIYVRNLGIGTGLHHGVFNNMTFGNGAKFGVRNDLSGTGSLLTGVVNNMTGSGNGDYFATNNFIRGTGNGSKFGSFNRISGVSGGDLYGVYSSVIRNSGTTFAGFFVGNFAIGTEVFDSATPNHYTMPVSRGITNQIMQTDATGNVSWVDPSTVGTDNQNISGSGLSGTTLTIGIENGASETVDLSSLDNDHDFYKEGTTNAPSFIGDNIYTLGNVAIGKDTANFPLDIEANTYTRGVNIVLGGNLNTSIIANNITINTTGFGWHYGSYKRLFGVGDGEHFGALNHVSNSGNGSHYGTYNRIEGTGNGNKYGTYNRMFGTGIGNKYGSYNNMITSAGGTHYGVYSSALKSGGFAGYFLGNVSIGTTTTNNYILPASRGTNNQIMQSDASGNVSWVNAPAFTNASNGLSINANNIVLGGTLTQATTITQGTNTLTFNLNSTGDFRIQDNGTTHFEVRDTGLTYFGDDTYWNDGSTTGTTLARLYDGGSGNDGVFEIYKDALVQHQFNSAGTSVINELGQDFDFRIEGDTETNLFRVDAGNDRIGIMEDSPDFDIHLKQSTRTENGAGGIGLESSDTSNNWKIYHSGVHFSFSENGVRRAYITGGTGAYAVTSDKRLKKNIVEVESILNKVNNLKTYRYLYKDQEISAKKTIGFMAQAVQKDFPELVETGEDGYLGLNYSGFGVIAIKAIQEQQELITKMQTTISRQDKKIKTLEALLNKKDKTFLELNKRIQKIEVFLTSKN